MCGSFLCFVLFLYGNKFQTVNIPQQQLTSHQLPSWNRKLATGRDTVYATDVKTHKLNTWRILPPIPETPWAKRSGSARISDYQSHYPGWNKEHPSIHEADAPPGWTAKQVPQAAEDRRWLGRRENSVEDQAPSWDVSSVSTGSGWYQEILPVARKGQPEGQHRGSDHGSTRTSPKNEIQRGRDLHSTPDPRCRLCKDAPETVQHIVAECKTQTGTEYT